MDSKYVIIKVLNSKINLDDKFFDSLKIDYQNFLVWFNNKLNDYSYCCYLDNKLVGLLSLKLENEYSSYNDITPTMIENRKLKISTLKVIKENIGIGNKFMEITIDYAYKNNVNEIYITFFINNNTSRLPLFLNKYDFKFYGLKENGEQVYIKYIK